MAKQERDDVHSVALLAKLCIAEENLSKTVNVFSKGSPSRMRMVLRISLGITTRPRSSIRRTIPVAFIYLNLLFAPNRDVSICKRERVIRKDAFFALCLLLVNGGMPEDHTENPDLTFDRKIGGIDVFW